MLDRSKLTHTIGKETIIEPKVPSQISEVTRHVEFISNKDAPIRMHLFLHKKI
jgi:hypothetical protein